MNLEQYRHAWKTESNRTKVTIDTESVTNEVQSSQQQFRSMIFWRDVREIGLSLFLIPVALVACFTMTLPWTCYLTVLALAWVAGFMWVDRRRHPQRPSDPGEPLLYYAKESLTQVEHQIWLLRNVFWWYLLPILLAIMAFFFQVAWESSSDWWEFSLSVGSRGVFLLAINWAIYLVNQYSISTTLEPRRRALANLVESLEVATDQDDGGDLMELVSTAVAPVLESGLNSNWADWASNWNQSIPSWRVASAIILPTLGGALCGLCSGLMLPMYDMGPTLFQTVVGAVIPFEIALFWVLWRSWKHRQSTTADSNVKEPNSDQPSAKEEVEESANEKLTPRAPALVIIFLILFLSVMAVAAIVSCVSELRSNPASRDAPRRSEPHFDDISGFTDKEIEQVDAWLQQQMELAQYPSLSVAIVRDGSRVYGKSLGFENVKAGKKATLQTQYHVASVTKAFTASLAVMLHERGIVNLDHPAATYLPDSVSISTTPEMGKTITLRQLASHTSGLPRRVPGRVQSAREWYELEPERLYKHLGKVPLESDPGTAEEYSNLAFGLLGHVLELAADRPFADLIQEFICDPLELSQTAIQADSTVHPATGYDGSGRHFEESHSLRRRLAGSGGLVSSVEDLSMFIAAQMEPKLFTAEMLQELHTRTKRSDGIMIGTTLGWSSAYNSYIGRFLTKNGGRNNCSAWIGCSTEHNVGIVVVTNCGGPDVDWIGERLLERTVAGAYKPVRKFSYAKVAPFTGVRWENDRPIVCVNDAWSPLVSIDGIAVADIMEFSIKEFGEIARKRFAEDLVELLSKMGHEPDWEVRLGLQTEKGTIEELQVRMTAHNRSLVRE